MHLRIWGNGAAAPHTCLVCLHPVPYSGRYFDTFAERVAADTVVVTPDLIGYGGSSAMPEPIAIEDHAAALADALDSLHEGGFRDTNFVPLGFHTGSAVGGEMAIAHPELVSKVVFVTYPYFEPAERARRLEGLPGSTPITTDAEYRQSRWDFTIANRPEGVPLARGFVNFSEELRAGDRAWFGFHSMFSYAPEGRLPLIKQPALVINPEGPLRDPTHAAAQMLVDCDYRELLHMQKAVFELNAKEIAGAVRGFLRPSQKR
jgi:pimeloyl-ACP methyl ester carboxylesterase